MANLTRTKKISLEAAFLRQAKRGHRDQGSLALALFSSLGECAIFGFGWVLPSLFLVYLSQGILSPKASAAFAWFLSLLLNLALEETLSWSSETGRTPFASIERASWGVLPVPPHRVFRASLVAEFASATTFWGAQLLYLIGCAWLFESPWGLTPLLALGYFLQLLGLRATQSALLLSVRRRSPGSVAVFTAWKRWLLLGGTAAWVLLGLRQGELPAPESLLLGALDLDSYLGVLLLYPTGWIFAAMTEPPSLALGIGLAAAAFGFLAMEAACRWGGAEVLADPDNAILSSRFGSKDRAQRLQDWRQALPFFPASFQGKMQILASFVLTVALALVTSHALAPSPSDLARGLGVMSCAGILFTSLSLLALGERDSVLRLLPVSTHQIVARMTAAILIRSGIVTLPAFLVLLALFPPPTALEGFGAGMVLATILAAGSLGTVAILLLFGEPRQSADRPAAQWFRIVLAIALGMLLTLVSLAQATQSLFHPLPLANLLFLYCAFQRGMERWRWIEDPEVAQSPDPASEVWLLAFLALPLAQLTTFVSMFFPISWMASDAPGMDLVEISLLPLLLLGGLTSWYISRTRRDLSESFFPRLGGDWGIVQTGKQALLQALGSLCLAAVGLGLTTWIFGPPEGSDTRLSQAIVDALGAGFEVPGMLALAFGLAVVVAPLVEELFFRGLLQSALTQRFGSYRWATLATALLFASLHPKAAFLGTFGLGWISAENVRKSRGLMTSILGHALHNATLLGLALFLLTAPELSSQRPPPPRPGPEQSALPEGLRRDALDAARTYLDLGERGRAFQVIEKLFPDPEFPEELLARTIRSFAPRLSDGEMRPFLEAGGTRLKGLDRHLANAYLWKARGNPSRVRAQLEELLQFLPQGSPLPRDLGYALQYLILSTHSYEFTLELARRIGPEHWQDPRFLSMTLLDFAPPHTGRAARRIVEALFRSDPETRNWRDYLAGLRVLDQDLVGAKEAILARGPLPGRDLPEPTFFDLALQVSNALERFTSVARTQKVLAQIPPEDAQAYRDAQARLAQIESGEVFQVKRLVGKVFRGLFEHLKVEGLLFLAGLELRAQAPRRARRYLERARELARPNLYFFSKVGHRVLLLETFLTPAPHELPPPRPFPREDPSLRLPEELGEAYRTAFDLQELRREGVLRPGIVLATPAQVDFGQALWSLSQGNPNGALRRFEDRIEDDPQDLDSHAGVLLCLAREGLWLDWAETYLDFAKSPSRAAELAPHPWVAQSLEIFCLRRGQEVPVWIQMKAKEVPAAGALFARLPLSFHPGPAEDLVEWLALGEVEKAAEFLEAADPRPRPPSEAPEALGRYRADRTHFELLSHFGKVPHPQALMSLAQRALVRGDDDLAEDALSQLVSWQAEAAWEPEALADLLWEMKRSRPDRIPTVLAQFQSSLRPTLSEGLGSRLQAPVPQSPISWAFLPVAFFFLLAGLLTSRLLEFFAQRPDPRVGEPPIVVR